MPAFVSSFIPAAGDTPGRGERGGVIELWQVLSTLADPRDRRGLHHGHGRTEQRSVQLIAAVHPRLEFTHARLTARIVRTRTTASRVQTREVV